MLAASLKDMVPPPVKVSLKKVLRLCRLAGSGMRRHPSFLCPICGHHGRFLDDVEAYGRRAHAICPWCGAYERHRLQHLVLEELFAGWSPAGRSAIHFAPEPIMRRYLKSRFAVYHTADINPRGVDFEADISALPFADRSYDFVFASHVLEHVTDDRRALAEIARILTPGGIAILPVPVFAAITVEYPHPMPQEENHVRAPGRDYFDRYREVFAEVRVAVSDEYPEEHQVHVFEDRTSFSAERFPYRPRVPGVRHLDYVPICRAGAS